MTKKFPEIVNRGAQPSEFGWQFQIMVGIELALQNIEKLDTVSIEGPLQDIEVSLRDESMIFGQAKSAANADVENVANTGWHDKLTSGMVSLFEDFMQKKGHNESANYLYIVNYPFPLGKQKKGNRLFHKNEYGDVPAGSLLDENLEFIRQLLVDSGTNIYGSNGKTLLKGKSQIINSLIKEGTLDSNFIEFINKTTFRTERFINFDKGGTRQYSELDRTIQNFLTKNFFEISYSRLRDYWLVQGLENGSKKYSIDRSKFLFALIIESNEMSQTTLFGRRLNASKVNHLFERFRETVETTMNLENFNRSLMADLLKYFHIAAFEQFEYDDLQVEKFVDDNEKNYRVYFLLDNVTDHEVKLLTRFAMARWVEQEDNINRILSKDGVKGVH